MARSFDGVNQYLSHAAAILTAPPITLAGWFYNTDGTANDYIISIGASATSNGFALGLSSTEVVFARSQSASAGGADDASSTGNASLNAWTHGCAVFRSSTSRDAYRDGGNKGSNTDSNTPGGTINQTFIGQIAWSPGGNWWKGQLAEVAIWNTDLSDDDVAALGRGYIPPMVRPDALVAYWPLFGRSSPEPDFIGGFGMTLNGTPAHAAHPRIIRPRKSYIILPALTQISIEVPVGELTLTGFAPDVRLGPLSLTVPAGELVLGGEVPKLISTINIPPGEITLSGLAPFLNYGYVVPNGELTLTGFAPQLQEVLTVPAGELTLTGLEPLVGLGPFTIEVPFGEILLEGFEPLFTGNYGQPTGAIMGNEAGSAQGLVDKTGSAQIMTNKSGSAQTLHDLGKEGIEG